MKKANLILLLALIFSGMSGQSNFKTHLKKLYCGAYIGASKPNIHSLENLPENTSIHNNWGLNSGILLEYQLINFISISQRTGISFKKSKVIFTYPENVQLNYYLRLANIDLNFDLILKLSRKRIIPYFLTGIKIDTPIEGIRRDNDCFPMKTHISQDFGTGIEFKVKKTKISPEIRYYFSKSNINTNAELPDLGMTDITISLIFKHHFCDI